MKQNLYYSSDYKNAAIITSVDRNLQLKLHNKRVVKNQKIRKWWHEKAKRMVPDTDPDFPFALLGNHGWDKLHPFVPIEVTNYNDGEMDAMIDFYVDKRSEFKLSNDELAVMPKILWLLLQIHPPSCLN